MINRTPYHKTKKAQREIAWTRKRAGRNVGKGKDRQASDDYDFVDEYREPIWGYLFPQELPD